MRPRNWTVAARTPTVVATASRVESASSIAAESRTTSGAKSTAVSANAHQISTSVVPPWRNRSRTSLGRSAQDVGVVEPGAEQRERDVERDRHRDQRDAGHGLRVLRRRRSSAGGREPRQDQAAEQREHDRARRTEDGELLVDIDADQRRGSPAQREQNGHRSRPGKREASAALLRQGETLCRRRGTGR